MSASAQEFGGETGEDTHARRGGCYFRELAPGRRVRLSASAQEFGGETGEDTHARRGGCYFRELAPGRRVRLRASAQEFGGETGEERVLLLYLVRGVSWQRRCHARRESR